MNYLLDTNILVPKEVTPMTKADKELLRQVAEKIKGREFFLGKKERAKDILKDVGSIK